MGLLTPAAGERFLVRTFKYWEGIYDREWVNNYFIIAMSALTIDAIESAVEQIKEWEVLVHDGRVTFARVVVSTYAPDSEPYDGNEFVVYPFTGTGERAPGLLGDILPLTTVRYVRLAPALGRSSLLGYRGSIYEGEVNSGSGRMEYDSPSTQQTMIEGWADATIAPLLDPLTEDMRLCSGSTTARPIMSLSSVRPGHLPMKHKYYDVSP